MGMLYMSELWMTTYIGILPPPRKNELKDKKIYPLHYEIYLPLLTPP